MRVNFVKLFSEGTLATPGFHALPSLNEANCRSAR